MLRRGSRRRPILIRRSGTCRHNRHSPSASWRPPSPEKVRESCHQSGMRRRSRGRWLSGTTRRGSSSTSGRISWVSSCRSPPSKPKWQKTNKSPRSWGPRGSRSIGTGLRRRRRGRKSARGRACRRSMRISEKKKRSSWMQRSATTSGSQKLRSRTSSGMSRERGRSLGSLRTNGGKWRRTTRRGSSRRLRWVSGCMGRDLRRRVGGIEAISLIGCPSRAPEMWKKGLLRDQMTDLRIFRSQEWISGSNLSRGRGNSNGCTLRKKRGLRVHITWIGRDPMGSHLAGITREWFHRSIQLKRTR